jgi:hypothetical protein
MTVIANQIGDYAFLNCGKLININIPSKFTSIGNSIFQNCISIKNATIPNTIISTGTDIFNGCINLTTTTISNNLTTIGNNSYINCISLKTITIPNNVTSIGQSAFESSGLTSIIFPLNVKSIGENAFKNNYALKSLNVQNNLAYINNDCFYNCTSLFSITIPSGVTINGNNTFYNIPQNNKPTPTNAATLFTTSDTNNTVLFYFINNFGQKINYTIISILVYSLDNVNYYISNFSSTEAFVGDSPNATGYTIIKSIIPYNNKSYTVKQISPFAFQNCKLLRSIKIPSTFETIGYYAFQNCILLSSCVIPNGINIINNGTFSGCKTLNSIVIPNNVTSIGKNAFDGCTSINNITVPYGLLRIESYAFQNCSLLSYFTIPSGVNVINDYTFNGCKSLASIIVPNNSTSIGNYAFNNCRSLLTIVIPSSVTQIGDFAFVNIPNNANPTSKNAATLYTNFLQVSNRVYNYFFDTFQNNIEYRNVMPIYSSQNINYYNSQNDIYYNGKTKYNTGYVGLSPNANGDILLDATFTDNSGIEYTVKSIYENSFQDCQFLTFMEIPIGIETIGDSAFQSCISLNTIKVSNTVVSIGRYVFYDCISLYFLYIPSSVRWIGDNTFNGIPYNNTLHSTTQKNASTLYTSPLNASNYTYTYLYNLYTNKINYVIYPKPIICFKEDTKILTKDGYRPIQDLRPGDLIKTIKHGYKAINMIGYREIYNPICEERIKDKLYKCTYKNFPEVFEDLVITGCHSILVDNFKDDVQVEKTRKLLGDIYLTDDKWRLPACIDERTIPYEKEGTFTIYHLALDNDDYYMNYGIYANGLVVETCSKRFLKELAQYNLLL